MRFKFRSGALQLQQGAATRQSRSGGKMHRMTHALRNPNYQGPFGNTLLHSAVVSGDINEVQRLLAAGADPKIANRNGQTPLRVAVILGHENLYGVLGHRADDHIEELLDQALEATFPASDPIAVTPA
jgi:ankyrin repeat protein